MNELSGDTIVEKLRQLAGRKSFIYIAVLVFSFVTALIFALIANQSDSPTVDSLRQDARDKNRIPQRSQSSINDDGNDVSPLGKLIQTITGRRPTAESTSTVPSTIDTTKDARTNVSTYSKGEGIYEKIMKEATPLPVVQVKKYTLNTTLPEAPKSVKIYKLKTSYSEDEFYAMSQRMGVSKIGAIVEKNSNVMRMYDLEKNIFFTLDRHNGAFVLVAENGIDPILDESDAHDPRDIAEIYVANSGIGQPCLQVTDSYTSTTERGVTVVELRCNWEYLGAPLLNTIGVLNLKNSTPLSQVTLGGTEISTSFAGENEDYGTRGASDFNTMIIKVNSLGKIIHVGSNILPLEDTVVLSNDSIVAPQRAFTALQAGVAQQTFASPAGAGFVDFPSMYPNNIANAPEAFVSDFVLAYTVIPGIDQPYLCPNWVSRSTGELASGYDNIFVSTMKAVQDSRCVSPKIAQAQETSPNTGFAGEIVPTLLPNAVPTLVTGKSDTLKYDDIYFQGTKTPALGCPEASTFTNGRVLDESKGIYLMWAAASVRSWYVVFTSEAGQEEALQTNGVDADLTAEKRVEFMATRLHYAASCKPRTSTDKCPYPSGVAGQIISCVFLSTGSPSIYVHAPKSSALTIQASPFGGIGYADPAMDHTQSEKYALWNILAGKSNGSEPSKLTFYPQVTDSLEVTSKGIVKNRAYYEFRKYALAQKVEEELSIAEFGNDTDKDVIKNEAAAELKTPMFAVTLPKNTIAELIRSTISPALHLSQTETDDLVQEFTRELSQPSYDSVENVQLALLPLSFTQKNLSLKISPLPTSLSRYIFYIQPSDKDTTLDMNQSVSKLTALLQNKQNNIQKFNNSSDVHIVETGLLVRPL